MVVTAPRTRAPRSVVALRALGWMLLIAGLVVVLYLVYSLLFTSRETGAAQTALADEWSTSVSGPDTGSPQDGAAAARPAPDGSPDEPREPEDPSPADDSADHDETTSAGDTAGEDENPTIGDAGASSGGDPDRAVAILEFSRPGAGERPVSAEPLYVVGDVSLAALRRGPGHYPRSAEPGEAGNFAVAGHRTTYGAPFFRLDELRPGDEIHVTGRDGRRHTYEVREQRIVSPADTWVVEPEPLGREGPTLTLTTCHPRFSARQRLVVWAELV